MNESSLDRDPLEVLADEFLELARLGQAPSVEEFAAAHPYCADEIRELFPAIATLERFKSSKSEGTAEAARFECPAQLGDFRIVREIGRGGMGIVYEAEQVSLSRRVALKVLPQQTFHSATRLERFRQEARTAAALHHTNIVPVFGVGEADGVHFLVMQLIEGTGLDEIDATAAGIGPPHWRGIAAAAAQIADALSYAHGQGTLHRDIKPANLILDQQHVVWITDFGLAKAVEQEGLSRTGELVGTLRYMAPEQLRGVADQRSDVYSLGLTLYELLTSQPAFDATTPSQLIQQVAQLHPTPPRKLDPRVPRDLETIVLKAIAKDPTHRYQQAEELADDLRRFVQHRPIRARRASAVEQTWRWARRNPITAGLAAAVLLLLAASASGLTVAYWRTQQALAGESEQRARAEATSQLAQRALSEIFDRFAPDTLPAAYEEADADTDAEGNPIELRRESTLTSETAAALESLLHFYDQLADESGDDSQLLKRSAEANHRVGEIQQRLGNFPAADAAYHRALDAYTELARAGPFAAPRALTLEAVRIQNELGNLHWENDRFGESRAAHERALASLERHSDQGPPSDAWQYELARTYYLLGRRRPPPPDEQQNGNLPPPPRDRRRPPPHDDRFAGRGQADLRQRPGPPRPGSADPDRPPRHGPPPPRHRQPDSHPGGPPGPRNDRPHDNRPAADRPPPPDQPRRRPPLPRRDERGREYLLRAAEVLEQLSRKDPLVPEYRYLLACCYRDLPPAQQEPRHSAIAHVDDGVTQRFTKLVADFPDRPDFRNELSELYARVDLRNVHTDKDFQYVEDRLSTARALSQALVDDDPEVPKYTATLAHIYRRQAELHDTRARRLRPELRQIHLTAAEENWQRANAWQAKLVERFPSVATYRFKLALFQGSWADALMDLGRSSEAVTVLDSAIAALESLPNEDSFQRHARGLIDENQRRRARALRVHTSESN